MAPSVGTGKRIGIGALDFEGDRGGVGEGRPRNAFARQGRGEGDSLNPGGGRGEVQ